MSDNRARSKNDESFAELPLRVGLGQFMEPSEERLSFIKQLGVKDILLNMYQYDPDYPHMPDQENMPLEGEHEWSYQNLRDLRQRIESAGLRLNAIENVPISFYDKIMLGLDGRDEQLEHMKNTIRNLGRAGIPIFGYHWSPSGVWRTGEVKLRGGATATSFNLDDADSSYTHGREFSESEMWNNYEYFLSEVVPVAEKAGVKLCIHPNDPPVESLGGIPQLMRSFDNFKRAMNLVPSDNHGLEFCLGCWSEMGADLEEVIRYFGSRNKLFYVHFRNVKGTVPSFHESWIDDGYYDALEIVRLLKEVGFSGMMIPDHTPHLIGDTDWDHRGRAYTIGYLKALLRCAS